MMDSSPVWARGTPPDTGASTTWTPRGSSAAASRSVSAGSAELISTTSAPGRSAAPIPQPRIASATIAPLGSMVTTMSAAAKSAGAPAVTLPGCAAAKLS